MRKKADIIKDATHLCNAVSEHLESYCRERDEESLHKLRVVVKKLRALLWLLQRRVVHKPAEAKAVLKPLFTQAGLIRSAQMHLAVVKSHGITCASFVQQQQRLEEESGKTLCKKKKQYLRQVERAKKIITQVALNIPNGEARKRIEEEWRNLFLSTKWPVTSDGWHDKRKKIKRLFYALDFLPKAVNEHLPLDKEWTERLTQKLGEWHDTVLTAEALSGFGLHAEARHLQRVSEACLAKIKSMLEQYREAKKMGQSEARE